jgi:hypothetical protein
MKTQMRVCAKRRENGFEGLVSMPNVGCTKLMKENKCSMYRTLPNLRQAALAAARRYNCDLVFSDETKKVAAKKTMNKKK